MAQAWDVLLPDLTPDLPGCPVAIIRHEIRRAAQQFFTGTRAWRVDRAAIAVPAATVTVSVTPADTGQQLVRIEDAWFDGSRLDPKTLDDMLADHGAGWESDTGVPSECVQLTPGVLRLYPIPAAAAATGITALLSVAPSETATGIPDELMVAFRQSLVDGTKGRLMLHKDKPWTDLTLGAAHAAKFQAAIDAANFAAALAFGRSSRVRARPAWC